MLRCISEGVPVNRRVILLWCRCFFWFRLPCNPLSGKILMDSFHCATVKPIFQFLRYQFPIRIDDDSRNRIPIFVMLHKVKDFVRNLTLVCRMPQPFMLLDLNPRCIQCDSGILSFTVHFRFMQALADKIRQLLKPKTVYIVRLCLAIPLHDNHITH